MVHRRSIMPKASLQVVQDLLRVILALSAFRVIVPLIIYDATNQTGVNPLLQISSITN